MTDPREPLFDLRDQAVDEAAEARYELAEQLDHDEDYLPDFTEAMTSVAYRQPYARWWTKVTDQIEDEDLDPMAALANVRAAAGQILLQHAAAPCAPCPHADSLLLAFHEATRRFYDDTAPSTLETICEIKHETCSGNGAGTAAPSPPEPACDTHPTALVPGAPNRETQRLASRYRGLIDALLHLTGADADIGAAPLAALTTPAVMAARELALAVQPLIVHLPAITAALDDAIDYRCDDGGWCRDCNAAPGDERCIDHAADHAKADTYQAARDALTATT